MRDFFIILGIILCMVAVGTIHTPSAILVGGLGALFLWFGVKGKTPKQRKNYRGTVDLFRNPELRYRIEKKR